MNKIAELNEMVEERKACRQCPLYVTCSKTGEKRYFRLVNPSEIENAKYDYDYLDPWHAWKGDPDAKIMIVGQDWNDVDSFVKQEGKVDPNNATNKALRELFEYIGVDFDHAPLFMVNGILCMKQEVEADGVTPKPKQNKSLPVWDKWVELCANRFLKRVIRIVQPKMIITLGLKPINVIKTVYRIRGDIHPKQVAESGKPIELPDGIKWAPMFHCGRLGQKSVPLDGKNGKPGQKDYWAKLIKPYI